MDDKDTEDVVNDGEKTPFLLGSEAVGAANVTELAP